MKNQNTDKKRRVRTAFIASGLVMALSCGGAAAWAADRFLVEHVEIADVSEYEAQSSTAGTDSGAADLRFHKAIAAASGNNLAVAFYGMLRQVASDARMRLGRNQPACPKRIQQRDAEHRAIATAITARDADGAEQAMRMHLAAVQKRVIEHLHPLTAAM